ncbi:MAG: Ig-like domain-containing protein [Pelovirga sp.]
MRTLSICWHGLLGLTLLLALSACEGGGGDAPSSGTTRSVIDPATSTATSLSGQVADGYLRDARVFIDRNDNRQYDSGEPMAFSVAGGHFSLSTNPGEGGNYPVVVEVVAGQTIDEDTGQAVTAGYLLESPPGHWQFISPLTTLVNLELHKNPTMTVQRAALQVKSRLGIVDDVSIFEDYLDPGTAVAELLEEYRRTHQIARIVAALMGTLRAEITANLGGQISGPEQRLVAFLISDQILQPERAGKIKEAFNRERNYEAADVDVNLLIDEIADLFDTASLDRQMLDLYARRIALHREFWDMDPPQIMSRSPLPGAVVAVDTEVAVVFDKPLDSRHLAAGTIELIGPAGPVAGALDYQAAQGRLVFIPHQTLLPDVSYEVVINRALTDELGNSLGREVSWQFSTLYASPPPVLSF